MSEYMKIGHEEPNQSNNISVAAAPFPIQKSHEICKIYILRRNTAEPGHTHTVLPAGSHPQ